MNAIAVMYVNQHLDSMRTENKRNWMASGVAKPSLRSRLAAAVASLRVVTSNSDPIVPKLTNYPYGG